MATKTKHAGLHTHRLKQNPWEAHFAEAWRKINDHAPGRPTSTIAFLLAHPDRTGVNAIFPEEPSDRDVQVAATVIQWLGSQVGHSWLTETLKTLPTERFKDEG